MVNKVKIKTGTRGKIAETFGVSVTTVSLAVGGITKSELADNAVTKMNVLGAAIGVVTAAVAVFALFRKGSDEATDAMKRAKETAQSYYAQEKTGLDIMFEKLRRTNPKSKERNELVDELKRMYPDLNKQVLDEIRNTNDLSDAYDILIGKIRQRTKTEALNKTLKGTPNVAALRQKPA